MSVVSRPSRTELRQRATRLRLREVAHGLILQQGVDGTTIQQITDGADIGFGTFYNYYRSKDEVFTALSDDGARRFAPILKGLRGKGAPLEQFVREAIGAYFEFSADEQEACRIKLRSPSLYKKTWDHYRSKIV